MNNFSDMLSNAKKMQEKMKEVQESLKKIEVEGVSGGNLVKIILGGEALNITDVRNWLDINPESQFYNEYGPTEATVGVSQHTYTIDNCMESVGAVSYTHLTLPTKA